MLKIERIKYERKGNQRLFYITENEIQVGITTHIFTSASGMQEAEFRLLEFGVWVLDFVFDNVGKYIFIIFEDGLKKVIFIVTIIT